MAALPAKVERLVESVSSAPGECAGIRRAILAGAAPDELRPLVDKVDRAAHRVTDGDLDRLRGRGLSETAILEIVLAASLESGLRRMRAGLDAIERA